MSTVPAALEVRSPLRPLAWAVPVLVREQSAAHAPAAIKSTHQLLMARPL